MSKICDIKGFSIESDFFNEKLKGNIFPNPKDRVALLYSRNGGGKSTIARGFNSVILNTKKSLGFNLLDTNDKILDNLNDEQIFVFNEDYINSKIRVTEDQAGLDTIVLIGDQTNIDSKIKTVTKSLSTVETYLERQIKLCSEFQEVKNPQSTLFHLNKCIQILKNGWAIRDSKIKNNKVNSRVTDDFPDLLGKYPLEIAEKSIEEYEIEITKEFDSKLDFLIKTSANQSTITKEIPMLSTISDNFQEDTEKLLGTIIDKPVLTEREQLIYSYFEKQMNKLNYSKEFLLVENHDICELCLQPISESYRKKIMQEIDNIISKEYDKFINDLEKCKLKLIDSTIYDQFKIINQAQYNLLVTEITKLNEHITSHNEIVDLKFQDPFSEIEYHCSKTISGSIKSLNNKIAIFEKQRLTFNNGVSEKNKFKDELFDLNKQIAYCEIKNDYEQYEKQLAKQTHEENRLKKLKNIKSRLLSKKANLKVQLRNTEIAIPDINKALSYIFYDKTRLVLEPNIENASVYNLKVNGHSVSPNRVSTGERNAIALCYFFTEIAKDKKIESMYSDSTLLIFDDPITSFDIGNRVGIMSFLKLKLQKILLGNCESKCLLMTHDVRVMFDFLKCFEEISKTCNTVNKVANFNAFELKYKRLEQFKRKTNNEYNKSFQSIYKFAKKDPKACDQNEIGNVMRRVLEGFSTFSYKKGIADISCDRHILDLLPPEKVDYFESSMYRLVLHGTSHLEESVKGEIENQFDSYLSYEEIVKTAKDIIVFMYILNPLHVLSQLETNHDRMTISRVIDSWNDDI